MEDTLSFLVAGFGAKSYLVVIVNYFQIWNKKEHYY